MAREYDSGILQMMNLNIIAKTVKNLATNMYIYSNRYIPIEVNIGNVYGYIELSSSINLSVLNNIYSITLDIIDCGKEIRKSRSYTGIKDSNLVVYEGDKSWEFPIIDVAIAEEVLKEIYKDKCNVIPFINEDHIDMEYQVSISDNDLELLLEGNPIVMEIDNCPIMIARPLFGDLKKCIGIDYKTVKHDSEIIMIHFRQRYELFSVHIIVSFLNMSMQ